MSGGGGQPVGWIDNFERNELAPLDFWNYPDWGDNASVRSGGEPFWMRPPLFEPVRRLHPVTKNEIVGYRWFVVINTEHYD